MKHKRYLYVLLRRLREALAKADEDELVRRLDAIIGPLAFYEVLPPTSILISITGPQGTGKSTLANKLLGLKTEEKLPTGLQRAERIPVILIYFDKTYGEYEQLREKPVKIYKFITNSDVPVFSVDVLTYEKGKQRVTRPEREDTFAFWYVYNNPVLKRLGPIVVLPGFELESAWEGVVLDLIKISDAVLYVVDKSRLAQREAKVMEEFMSRLNTPTVPIAVVTKSIGLDKTQKKDISSRLANFPVVFVDSIKDFGFKELDEIMVKMIASLPHGAQTLRIEELAKNSRRLAKKAKRIATTMLKDTSFEVTHIIEKVIEPLDETWNNIVKVIFETKIDDIINKRVNKAREEGRKAITEVSKGFVDKIKIVISGGPDLEKIEKIENAVKNAFIENLDEELIKLIEQTLTNFLHKDQDDLSNVVYMKKLLSIMLLSPVHGRKGETFNIKSIQEIEREIREAYNLSDRLIEFLKGNLDSSRNLGEEVRKFMMLVRKNPKDASLLTLNAVVSGVGATEAAAEASGGGIVSGTLPSAVAGIVSGVVAVVAASAVATVILRSARKMEYELDSYISMLALKLSDKMKSELIKRFEIFWNIYRWYIKWRLTQLLGESRDTKIALELLSAANDVLEATEK